MIVGLLIGLALGLTIGVYAGIRWAAPRSLAKSIVRHGFDGAEQHLAYELLRSSRRRRRRAT